MDPAAYLDHLAADGESLATAARRAPSAPIPSCPDWDMSGLVAHVGGVHSWVDQIVATRSQSYMKRMSSVPEGAEAILGWYRQGLSQLLTTLKHTDPDAAVWNWRDQAPAPAHFWFRRMAHETAVHRWDGQAGAGEPQPIATDLAVDGIDEYLSFVERWLAGKPVAGLQGSLHLHATDTDGEWSLDLWPERVEHRREHAKADAAVRGPVSDLLLWMLNRLPVDSPTLQVFGDSSILERWSQLQF